MKCPNPGTNWLNWPHREFSFNLHFLHGWDDDGQSLMLKILSVQSGALFAPKPILTRLDHPDHPDHHNHPNHHNHQNHHNHYLCDGQR